MGCSENKREQLTSGIYHLHMSDGTLEPADSQPRASRAVGKLWATDPLSPKRFQYLWVQKRSGYCDQRLPLLSKGDIQLNCVLLLLLLFSPFYFLLTYVVQCSFERS